MNVRDLVTYFLRFLATYVPERRQLPVLLASFCVSVLLWTLVTLAEEYQSTVEVNIQLGTDHTVVGHHNSTHRAKVGLKGSGLDLLLEHLRFSQDTIYLEYTPDLLDLSELNMQDHQASFVRYFTPKVSVQSIYPASLPIDFSLKDRKKVPVRMGTHIAMPPGYQLSAPPILFQDSVWVIGAAEVIDSIRFWPTIPGFSKLVTQHQELSVPLDSARNISTDPQEISILVDPVPYSEWKVRLPVRLSGLPVGTSVRMSHPEISCLIALPEQLKDSLEQSGGFPVKNLVISYTDLLESGNAGWKPTDELFPEQMKIITNQPERISYTVVRRQSSLN